jgi:hypothetical protein
MLTPGQDHDLACAQPLLENADPGALLGLPPRMLKMEERRCSP